MSSPQLFRNQGVWGINKFGVVLFCRAVDGLYLSNLPLLVTTTFFSFFSWHPLKPYPHPQQSPQKIRIFIFSSSIFSCSWSQMPCGLLSWILVLNFSLFRRHWKQSPGDFFLALWVLWVICGSSSHSLLFHHLSFSSCFGKIRLDIQIPVDSFALPASRNHKYVSWSPYYICSRIVLWKILHLREVCQ